MSYRFSLRRGPPLLAKHNHKRMPFRWSTRRLPRRPMSYCRWSQTTAECLSACTPALMRLSLLQPARVEQASARKQGFSPVGKNPRDRPENGGPARCCICCWKQRSEPLQLPHSFCLCYQRTGESYKVFRFGIPCRSLLLQSITGRKRSSQIL